VVSGIATVGRAGDFQYWVCSGIRIDKTELQGIPNESTGYSRYTAPSDEFSVMADAHA
jgi:hypothetical protein